MQVFKKIAIIKIFAALLILLSVFCCYAGEPDMLKGLNGKWYGRVTIEPAGKDWTITIFNTDVKKGPKGYSFGFKVSTLSGYSLINNDYLVQINPDPSGKTVEISLTDEGKKLFDAVKTQDSGLKGFYGEKKASSSKGSVTQAVSLQKNQEGNLEFRFDLSKSGNSRLKIIISLSKKKLNL